MPCYDVSMFIKSPNKSHPFIKFFAFLFSLLFLLISCSKPAQESANRETTAQEETTITLPEQNASESKEAGEEKKSEKNEAKIQAEKLCAESDEYKRKLDDLWIELDKKKEHINSTKPGGATVDDLINKRAETFFYDDKNMTYGNFEGVIKENDDYRCIYIIKPEDTESLLYDILYTKNINDTYSISDFNLKSNIDIGTVDESIIKKQVHGDVFDVKADKNSAVMIKLFEEYENTNYPIYRKRETSPFYKQEQLKVLDYVKANLTNSGYDEYLVLYEDVDKYAKDYISRVKCLIISGNKVIKDYCIAFPHNTYFLPTYYFYEYRNNFDNFGFQFSQGWINDFNQNGINEVYFSCVFSGMVGHGYLLHIEFNDNKFSTEYISIYNYDIDSIDWHEKRINVVYHDAWIKWLDSMIWNESTKQYVLESFKYM